VTEGGGLGSAASGGRGRSFWINTAVDLLSERPKPTDGVGCRLCDQGVAGWKGPGSLRGPLVRRSIYWRDASIRLNSDAA
jgi:hypothetical protein